MRQGLGLAGTGAALGLLAALWLSRLLQHQVFKVSPADPFVMAGALLVLVAAASRSEGGDR